MAILDLKAIPGLLIVGTDVQAWDAQLDDIAALAVTDSNFIVGDGTNWVAESGATVRTSLGLGTMALEAATDYVEIAGDTMTGPLVINDNSATALVVEQDGIKDNTLVVDTANGRVGIGKVPSKVFDMKGDYAGATADNSEEIVEIYDSNDVLRSRIAAGGSQRWYLSNTSAERGSISYSLPGGNPGVLFLNSSDEGRSQLKLLGITGGLAFGAGTGSGNPDNMLIVETAGNVVVGDVTSSGQLHIDQNSTTAAEPVLYLDQADVSEEFIDFVCTEGVGNAVEDVGGKTLTTTKFVRVSVNGVNLYLQAGTIA